MEISDHEYERLTHRSNLMDLAQDILIVLDLRGFILDVNEAAARLHGTTVEALVGTNCGVFLHPESVEQMMSVSGALYSAGVDGSDSMTLKAFRHNGETVHLELRVSFSHADQKFYVVERDVTAQFEKTTELEELSEKLRILAATDTLTGIPNRAAFDQRMEQIRVADEDAWLVMLDIDNFKTVNDTHGHVVGDALLKAVSNALWPICQPGELVARIGGDEFAIISASASTDFDDRLRQLHNAVNAKFELLDVTVDVACSLGVSRREAGEATTCWLRRSDHAMYVNKALRSDSVAA